MLKKAVFPGKYIQGIGAIRELPSLIELFGKRAMILASPTALKEILHKGGLDSIINSIVIEKFNGECCESEISRIESVIREKKIDVLAGLGGGKTIDTAKIASDRANIPVIIVPTIASTDAPCSGCAVLYSEEGVFQSVYYQRSNPAVVLIDTEVIARAPVRFLVSGMGDALATWFEAQSCSVTQSKNECGGISTLTGISLARLCYETLLQYGVEAKIACENQIVTPALEHIVEANTLLSGVGFESGGLASAHSIHNGLTALKETHSYYHGEKVAFGVLAGLQLKGTPSSESSEVYSFCEEVGLPITLAEIGVDKSDIHRLKLVAERACAAGEYIHHEAGDITPERVFYAMLAADAIGSIRKVKKFKNPL